MSDYLIISRSLTYAQRTERALVSAGFRAAVIRTPEERLREGCGYSVKLMRARLSDALGVLYSKGLAPKHVFVFDGGRAGEEVRL
ncbi:MAG: DUF3343 domain-containing protein [Oscillospiraceae bacterium]|nr:DUF3343 domain-containing protein [Oscillospiraceae bacterium]